MLGLTCWIGLFYIYSLYCHLGAILSIVDFNLARKKTSVVVSIAFEKSFSNMFLSRIQTLTTHIQVCLAHTRTHTHKQKHWVTGHDYHSGGKVITELRHLCNSQCYAAAAAAEGPCDACLRLNKGGEKYPGATTRPSRSTGLAPEGCGSLDPVCRALRLAEGLRGERGRHRGVEEQRSHSTGISADTVHALLATLQRYQVNNWWLVIHWPCG